MEEQFSEFGIAWRRLMSTPDGSSVLKALNTLYVLRRSHEPGDPYETAFREGQREIATFLIQLAREDN